MKKWNLRGTQHENCPPYTHVQKTSERTVANDLDR